jgi:arginine repressor
MHVMNNYAAGGARCRRPARAALPSLVRESVLELRQAQHLLLLRTERGRARKLAARVEREWPEVLCAVASTDLLVLVTPSGKSSQRLRKIIGEWVKK